MRETPNSTLEVPWVWSQSVSIARFRILGFSYNREEIASIPLIPFLPVRGLLSNVHVNTDVIGHPQRRDETPEVQVRLCKQLDVFLGRDDTGTPVVFRLPVANERIVSSTSCFTAQWKTPCTAAIMCIIVIKLYLALVGDCSIFAKCSLRSSPTRSVLPRVFNARSKP